MNVSPFSPTPFLLHFFSYFLRYITWLIPLLWVLLFLLFQPCAAIDNTAIAAVSVWGEPSPHLIYVGYLLSYPMMWARMLIPQLEWFTVTQYVLHTLSTTLLAHYILRPYWQNPGWKQIVGVLLLVGYMARIVSLSYFPFASVIGMAAAMVMMLKCSTSGKTIKVISAFLLLIVAASMRYDACPVLLPFAGALACLFLFQRYWKRCGLMLLVCACVLIINKIQPLFANVVTWEMSASHTPQNLIEINDTRMRFCDYWDAQDANKRVEYDKIGFSRNDQIMLQSFMLLNEKRASSEWWRKLRSIRDRDNERIPRSMQLLYTRLTSVSSYGCLGQHRVMMGIAAAGALLLFVPLPLSWKDPRLWIAFAGCAAMLVLIACGRSNMTSVWSVAILCFALMTAFMPHFPFNRRSTLYFSVILMIIGFGWCFKLIQVHFSPFKHQYRELESKIKLEEECASHPECRYLLPFHIWQTEMLPKSTIFSEPYQRNRNTFVLYLWAYEVPAFHRERESRGFESDLTLYLNPEYRYIVNKNNNGDIYMLSKLTTTYFLEHYGIQLELVLERELDEDYGVYRMQRVNH